MLSRSHLRTNRLRLELEDSAARAPPPVPHEVVKEVKVSVPDPAVVAELEKVNRRI
jgi:hypothetical protein